MAQDVERLERSLRAAANAGDNEAATRIAQAIRNRRAMGDQEKPKQPLVEEEPDPFATVPTEISGVTLSEDIRQQILDGRAIEDPKEKRLMAAQIAGTIAQQDTSGGFLADLKRGQYGAGLRGFGAGIFGIGDLAAAAGTTIGGIGDEGSMTFGEALEAQRAFRRGLEKEFPKASLAGELAGAVTGGGVAGAGLKIASAGSRVAPLISSVTQLKKGQTFRNIARLSVAGGTAGAITEGVLEGDPSEGAILGLAAGPLGVALTKAGEITKIGITKLLDDPAATGIKALAKKMGVKADEMARRFLEFKTVTGKNPAIADIANEQASLELRQMIASNTGAATVAREVAEAANRTRGGEIAEQLTGGRVTSTKAAQQARRTTRGEEQFAAAERDDIKFSRGQVADLLNDPDLLRGIPRTLRRRLDEAMDAAGEGVPVTLSGLDVNDLRKALRGRAKGATGADRVFGELADEVEEIARRQSKNFAQAIDEFSARSLRGEGVEAGRKVKTQSITDFSDVVEGATDPNVGAGVRVGARTAIEQTAREGSAQADALIKTLNSGSGLGARLKQVLPEAEFNKIMDVARVQARRGDNTRILAPGARAQSERGIEGIVDDTVGGIIAATGGAGAGFKSNVIVRIVKRVLPGANADVLENIARDVFDPAKTKQVLTALRRAEVSEEEILDLYAKVALSSGAGVNAIVE